MRILLLNTLYPPTVVGGAERSVEVLASGLAARGHAVAVVCLTDERDRTEIRDGVTVHRLNHGNVYWPVSGTRPNALKRLEWHGRDAMRFTGQDRLTQLVDHFGPDVVHTNNLVGFGSNVIPVLKQRSLPVVHTLRDFGLICSRSSLFKRLKDCEKRCISCSLLTARKVRAAGAIDLVVGNSTFMLEQHRHFGLFLDTPAKTIYNAVPGILDEPPCPPGYDHRATLRLGFAGAIKPEKGIESLLDATRFMPPDGWQLSIAGTGDEGYVSHLRKKYEDLPIDWLGFVPIGRFLDETDLLVIPSIWPEPMPRTLIEAMAHRLPVIVSDAGGAPEVARMYEGAQLYPRRDPHALAALLARAVIDRPPRSRPTAEVLRNFSVEQLVDRYSEAYRETIALHLSKANS